MAADRRGLAFGTKILIGVGSGIAIGLLFGELARPLEKVGEIYVGLLQMTVLPYVTVSLIGKIGGLPLDLAKRLAGRAGLVMLALWIVALAAVVALPQSLPAWEAGSFFTASLVETPHELDFIELYLPVNPFHSLANNIVPAAVLFSILLGAALIRVKTKERLLQPLGAIGEALSVIAGAVVKLSPYGTFAIAAGAAGTLEPAELTRLMGYVSTFTVGVLLLTFVALPGLVAAVTPFRFRSLMSGFKEAGLTAFATGKLFAVLPMVIASAKNLLVSQGIDEEEAETTANVFVPLGYPFPNAGKVLSLLFIPFAAWYSGTPLGISDYPMLLSIGLLSFFGSPVAAIPFLLDLFRLPTDLFPLFLIAGIWCARLGDLLGAMHLTAFTLLCSAWNQGQIQPKVGRLGRWLAGVLVAGAACLAINHLIVAESLVGRRAPKSRVAQMDLSSELARIVEEPEARPNPVALQPGETRGERTDRTKTLRVGYSPNSPPFCYRNADDKLVGFDVDLIQLLAYELELALHLVPYGPDQLVAGFAADHFDVAIGGIPSTIESFGRYGQTGPYLDLHTALVVPDHRVDEFQSRARIVNATGLRVGYASRSRVARTQRARFPGLELVELPSEATFLRDESPRVDALLTTAEMGAVLTMLYPTFSVVVPEGTTARVPVVFALHPDATGYDEVINTWVDLQRNDGTIDELYEHWILGRQTAQKRRRWSVIQDVFGWGR